MKLMWLGYLVYSFSICVIKLCIEIGLSFTPRRFFGSSKYIFCKTTLLLGGYLCLSSSKYTFATFFRTFANVNLSVQIDAIFRVPFRMMSWMIPTLATKHHLLNL